MESGSASNRTMPEKKERAKSSAVQKSKLKENENGVPAKRKRNGPAGIRIVGSRIYDSVNGKTCHQCRQKTMDFVAACTNQKNNKPCTIMYCHKCLLNRYGEKAEEVVTLEDWVCPKCRDICNCSICMKKRGYQPTGLLINTAKATGYSSVSEMLLKGSECLHSEKIVAESSKKNVVASSPRKRRKENPSDGKVDLNLLNNVDDKDLGPRETGSGKKSKKNKRDRSDEINTEICDEVRNEASNVHENGKKQKKSGKDELGNDDNTLARSTSACKLNQVANDVVIRRHQTADSRVEIPLPLGTELNSVAGIDIRTEDVGNALQFLEFCAVFGKLLDVKEEQPERILRDLLLGRTGRQRKISVTIQFHINLLFILLSEQGEECTKPSPSHGKDYWFVALKRCLSGSQSVLKAHRLDSLDKAAEYETLKASEKLRLLNLLCDEVLETEKVRNWMDDQSAKHAEKVKEYKQKVTAAKDEEKCLKQKMRDDVAKANIASHGVPLTPSDHAALVSDIKQKTEEAHAKVLESKGVLLKNNQHSKVRAEPIFVGTDGQLYWRLNCLGKADVLHQNAGRRDTPYMDDKWFLMDDEGTKMIENIISSPR